MANDRTAYQSESILAEGVTVSNDTWSTGINCNQLVLGPSGSGKTRNFLKPNLLQANASYLVLDTKGQLYKEVGPILKGQGYDVQLLDLAKTAGTIGYDPLDYIHRDAKGNPSERDIMTVATSLCPLENRHEPFWDFAAANYIASMLAFVVETMPSKMQTMDNVVRVFEQCGNPTAMNDMFESIADTNPESFALRNYRRAKCTMGADRMHSSIMGIIAEKFRCLSFNGVTELFRHKRKMNFAEMGHKKVALFVAISDVDYSLAPLTSLFVTQAIQGLEREADSCPGGMLPLPVRMFLDDFSNLLIPDFDKIISVIRSREIWCTVLCQSVSQLRSLYGADGAETIMGNCDVQLVLAFQDNATTQAYAPVAGKTPDTLRATPLGQSWLFVRGQRPRNVTKYDLTKHERYTELDPYI